MKRIIGILADEELRDLHRQMVNRFYRNVCAGYKRAIRQYLDSPEVKLRDKNKEISRLEADIRTANIQKRALEQRLCMSEQEIARLKMSIDKTAA